MDIVILTSTAAKHSADDSQAEKIGMAFADDFYDQNGFGTGSAKSGLIYFIDMSNRMPILTTTPYKVLTVVEAGVAAGAGFLAAAILYFIVQASYQLKGSTYHYNVSEHSSVQITGSRDEYLRTTISRIPRPRPLVNRGGGGRRF